MDKRKLMLLLGAMAIALGCAFAARSMFSGHAAPPAVAAVIAPSGPRVLVAQHALPVGTIITPDAVAFQAWPRDMVQNAYFLDGSIDRTKLIGTVVRNPITAGQPLTQGALVAPGDRGFLAAALGPGMRAVSLAVTETSGGAGFIFPGDHVDIMLTQSVKGNGPQGTDAAPLAITETMLRNLRVLATDQTTETEVAPGGKSVVKIAHDVTLEVTPRTAEKIEVAKTLGTLSLALRSLADDQEQLDQAAVDGKSKAPGGGQLAGNRPVEGATSFATGGDVSRFARRTLAVARAPSALPSGNWPSGPMVKVARGNAETTVTIGMGGVIRAVSGMPAAVKPMPVPMVGGQ